MRVEELKYRFSRFFTLLHFYSFTLIIMDFLKYTKLYFLISGVLALISFWSLISNGLKLGVDFTGGGVFEYKLSEEVDGEFISEKLESRGINVSGVQKIGENYLIKTPPLTEGEKAGVEEVLTSLSQDPVKIRVETVGPSVGPELTKKTMHAATLAAVGILFFIAIQFKSLKFGSAAIVAMLHDTFLLVGAFSLLGVFFDAEVDFLFVTAVLTTLSFSVHDTIVVFDRIRELVKKTGKGAVSVANQAISETMVRSLNNSFTIIFMLFALILLGGESIKWFAVALFVGVVLGTYSSPFIAVPTLVLLIKSKTKQ